MFNAHNPNFNARERKKEESLNKINLNVCDNILHRAHYVLLLLHYSFSQLMQINFNWPCKKISFYPPPPYYSSLSPCSFLSSSLSLSLSLYLSIYLSLSLSFSPLSLSLSIYLSLLPPPSYLFLRLSYSLSYSPPSLPPSPSPSLSLLSLLLYLLLTLVHLSFFHISLLFFSSII